MPVLVIPNDAYVLRRHFALFLHYRFCRHCYSLLFIKRRGIGKLYILA